MLTWNLCLHKVLRPWASTLTLLILTLLRITLSKGSFSDILGNDYWDHSDTFGENFDFYTFKSDEWMPTTYAMSYLGDI